MQEHPLTLTSDDDHLIHGTLFEPDQPRAVLVISHGMAEHDGRYAGFARWLGEHDIATITFNHRGHGPASAKDDLGHYSDQQGWHKVTDDLYRVLGHARARFPGVPVLLLGHSMGSFIAQSCIQQHKKAADALILSATNRINKPQLLAYQLLIGGLLKVYGRRHRSPTLTNLSFGRFNKAFEPARTDSDWLSRDPAQVDAYLADPLCGFQCTTGLWQDFVRGILSINPGQWPKDLPVHLFAGTEDPVAEMGTGVTRHFRAIRDAGVKRVTLRLFEGGRHEMLNETNVDQVRDYILSLCQSHIQPEQPGPEHASQGKKAGARPSGVDTD
ncbi:lysophospholipase [Marinobacter salinisoli]|uniref:Lysophospholipase n=1 Tax=Marinobacter salinisoli TaxID=2769486 RepID=A0ABX7MUR3_9GAMM|nr:alpha/beta hydrolase [Marinobacter salinisoli]QSP95237.1 lysophospholipase [Marinobacter salinisoli]